MHKKVKKFYEVDGFDYGYRRWRRFPTSRFDYKSTKNMIQQYLGKYHFHRALEIGCGPGTWTEILKKYVDNITAIDISSTMIRNAKNVVKDRNVSFITSDFMEFENDKTYDLIITIRVFEYISNKEMFLEKCYKILSPKGKLLIVTKTKKSYWYGKSKIRSILKKITPFLFYFEIAKNSTEEPVKTPKFYQERISVNNSIKLLRQIGFNNFSINPVILRPPLFMRGKSEIPVIPPFLEVPLLNLFYLFDNIFQNNHRFTIFAESYLIWSEKN